jgi:hypothetical protein
LVIVLLTGRSLAVGDGYVLNLPLHVLATRALQAGHLPFWNFFSFSGSPLLALGEAGIFYPPDVDDVPKFVEVKRWSPA